ncbi:hypothetical protein Hanom_Chr17g01579101 [Helianthus anomalus]
MMMNLCNSQVGSVFWACFGWRSCWFTKSEVMDIRINLAISAAFVAWIFIAHNAEWKLVQFF